jgi:acetyl esterase/lipase
MKLFRTFGLSLLMSLSCLLPGFAQQNKPGEVLDDPPWIKAFAHKRIVYSAPGMEKVKVQKGLTYKSVAGTELKMDVYSPPDSRKGVQRPAVLFIHGGRIPPNLRTTPREWGVYVSFGQLMAASGFVGVMFNHRFHAWESLADSQSDVMDAIAYVRNNADTLGVDKDRIVLWAFSAGGIFLSQPLREMPAYLRGIVAYYAILDMQGSPQNAPPSVTPEMLREVSPVHHLAQSKQTIPPIFIARAGLDNADLNAGTDRFVQTALAKNASVEVINHAAGQHGFDIEDDNDRTREIIRRTLEFIKACN